MRLLLVLLTLSAIAASGCATTRAPVEAFEGTSLLGSRRGQVDVYFLGVGAHASQEVFHNEALLARDRFRRRFGTEGREILLVNSQENAASHAFPVASLGTLTAAIEALGQAMDDEDVLILYFASHGKRRVLELQGLDPRATQRLRPGALSAWLKEAGIQRRVIFLSACYAGSFISDLEDEDTVVFTAASHRRPSFGCKASRRLTFFGKAYLQDAWAEDLSLDEIFDRALVHIARWEAEEGLRHSEPQRVEGARMKALLHDLEHGR